jgi:GT2 family glycosyltransferase
VATAVREVDLERIPPVLTGLDGYSRALILIRWHGLPAGKAEIPVSDGRIEGAALSSALHESLDWAFWRRWVVDHLGWAEPHTTAVSGPATIAVCTRNRPDDLRGALEALMRLPDDGQEVLVVDNAPSDDATRRLVAGYPRVRYVYEPRAGLDVARNRAIREARFDIVAFTDDDAAPDPSWLRNLVRNFAEDPLTMCATGLTMPLELETEAQEAFERYSPFGKGFRRRIFDGIVHDPLSVGDVGSGNNMALRTRVLDLVGPFDEALDGGTPTRTGGDHEMFSRILAAGYRIVYDPAALNWHRHRRTWEELRQTLYSYGTGVYAMWTRSLIMSGEVGVLHRGWRWFSGYQLPAVIRSFLRRPGSPPLDLLLAELRGCAAGPWLYLTSRRRLRRNRAH